MNNHAERVERGDEDAEQHAPVRVIGAPSDATSPTASINRVLGIEAREERRADSDSAPIQQVTAVIFMYLKSPPILRMSCSW